MKTYAEPLRRSEQKANAFQSTQSAAHNPSGSKGAALAPPAFHSTSSVVQKTSAGKGKTSSVAAAKRQIIEATDGWGTDEDAIYAAIRNCSNSKALMYDAGVIGALNGDMEGHELWRAHLLMEYGNEAAFPTSIRKLWKATSGAGTDEAAVFEALESMDKRAKTSFGLKYILHWELSGDELQRALDLIVVRDTIKGNIYGSNKAGQEDLVVNEGNLRKLIDSQFVGGASQGLKQAMMTLYDKPSGSVLTDAIARIESIRGLSPGSGLAQYRKAMSKRDVGVEYYKKKKEASGQKYDHTKDNPSPALDTNEHETFTASNAQLRFGKIVGDVFGIDAVFGSLISPTGGMAGPGNERIMLVKDGGAVATHGAVHDAAGYLYNCHGIGPGYDYLQSEVGSDPSDPFAGQTNMQWWIKEFDLTGNDVQWFERLLNSNAPILAAFSKKYGKLTTPQKKDVLKTMAGTSSLLLGIADISNELRVKKIKELMAASSTTEKTELANYFYNHDGFGTVSEVFKLMRKYVSANVYQNYWRRKASQHSMMF